MRKCIVSLIKDEYRYLKEWIQYHLGKIGIDEFILIEDFKSKSHKEICDGFHNVHLYRIEDYLDQEVMDLFLKNKDKIAWNNRQQYVFWQFLKNDYSDNFDLAIFIDVDEFIDFYENKYKSFDEVLLDYDGDLNCSYLLKWEYMTCDDPFIKLPYKYSVFNTFKRIAEINRTKYIKKRTKMIFNTKQKDIVLNMDFNDFYRFFPHYIKNKDFKYSIVDRGKARLNHYMTKSWDEYCNRLLVRGEITNLKSNRTFANFFDINTHVSDLSKYWHLYKMKREKVKVNS